MLPIRLSDEVERRLDALVRETGRPKSHHIRDAIIAHLDHVAVWSDSDRPVDPEGSGHDDETRLVLLSAGEYEGLARRDRRAIPIEAFTDEDMDLIAKAEVPADYAYLDDELKDWPR